MKHASGETSTGIHLSWNVLCHDTNKSNMCPLPLASTKSANDQRNNFSKQHESSEANTGLIYAYENTSIDVRVHGRCKKAFIFEFWNAAISWCLMLSNYGQLSVCVIMLLEVINACLRSSFRFNPDEIIKKDIATVSEVSQTQECLNTIRFCAVFSHHCVRINYYMFRFVPLWLYSLRLFYLKPILHFYLPYSLLLT